MSPRRRCRSRVVLVLAVAATAAACSPYSGGPAERVREWVARTSFITNANTIVGDIARIRRASTHGTPKQLRTICAGLVDDVGTTYESLPTPALVLTNSINHADEIMFRAANACSVASSGSSAATEGALVELGRGESALKRVQSVLVTFGVHWSARL